MIDQSLSGNNSSISSHPSSSRLPPTQVQDSIVHPQISGSKGHHSLSLSSTQKLPSKAKLFASQSKSMSSIAWTMEARIEGKEALLSVKMDIKMEKRKATKIANLKHARDLNVITEVKFKS